jgi:hypothetical protein
VQAQAAAHTNYNMDSVLAKVRELYVSLLRAKGVIPEKA